MLSIELGENHLSTSTIQLPSAASTNKMLPMLSIELGGNHLSTRTIQLPSAASTNKIQAHAIHWARGKQPIH